MSQLIIGSAIKTQKSIVVGLRHSDCYKVIASIYDDLLESKKEEHIEGFLTNDMQFVDRNQALKIVLKNKQKLRVHRDYLKRGRLALISEDLW